MSLDWKLSENHEELWNDQNKHMTQTIIHLTMVVGMGEITEKNYKEFFRRIHFYERACGAFMQKCVKGENSQEENKIIDVPFTIADVKRYIGLRTNVSKETEKQFVKRIAESLMNDAAWSAKQQETKLNALPEDVQDCIVKGDHLRSCDDDGYCNDCGHQESLESELDEIRTR